MVDIPTIELTVNTSVLLTGASGGIGKAIARALSLRGCDLILTGRGGDELDRLTELTGAVKVEADLAKRGDLRKLVKAANGVDVLIANAALPAAGMLDTYSFDEIDRALDVNLRSPILLARELAPGMVERRRGHIVFMSSLSSKFIAPGSSLYSSTKAGLRAFSTGLRQDLHGTGVGVSTIFPGPISDAGMWVDGGVEAPAGLTLRSPEDVSAALIRAVEEDRGEVDISAPIGRVGAIIGQLAPELAAKLNRRLGTRELAEQISLAHVQAGNR